MNQEKTNQSFSISPNVTGRFSWPTPDKLEFIPDSKFENGKRYKITVSNNAEDMGGLSLQNSIEGSFVVTGIDSQPPDLNCPACGANFELSGDIDNCGPIPNDMISQKSGSSFAANVCIQSPIEIEFSEEMNKTSVQNSISYYPNLDYSTTWLGNTIRIIPLNAFNSDKNYTLRISTSAKDISG